MTTHRRMLLSSGFLRNVATLIGATAFNQLVVFAALPVVIASFRYELAIPFPTAIVPRCRLQRWRSSRWPPLRPSPVCRRNGCMSGGQNRLVGVGFSLSDCSRVATAGAFQITNYWAVRKSKFNVVARTWVQQGLVGTGGQLALGCAGFGAVGLNLGHIIGQCAGVIRLLLGVADDYCKSGARLRRRGAKWAMKRCRPFPLYDSLA